MANPSSAKLVPQHQYNSAAPTNGSTNRYHKPNSHFHNHTKFGSNKYVFIDHSKQSKPAVSKLPVQPKNNDIQHISTKKFTGSRNDVFRFTAVPKPVSTTCTVVMKNSTTVQELCKKTNQPETVAKTATTNIHHKLKCV